MSTELEAALAAVIRRLGSIAVTTPDLIADLRQLAQQFLKLTEPPAVEKPETAEQVAEAVSAPATEALVEPAVPAVPPPRHEPLPTVSGVEVPVGWARRVDVSMADLPLIENRCRLKAEGHGGPPLVSLEVPPGFQRVLVEIDRYLATQLLPSAEVPKALEKAVARYAGPKVNLQFPLDEPIPYDLIERIVKLRVRRDSVKAAKRKKQK